MGKTHCTIRPYNHGDPDMARDPFSTNRRLFDSGGIELFGSMVVARPTTDVIYVLVPDNTTCSADEIAPADLQHVIGIRLGAPEKLGSNLPREDLHLSLCENSLRPTLIADRRVYWAEITPLLQRWQSVNNTACPHCHRLIRVNMSRHLRASHTDNQCFWRCPVSTCYVRDAHFMSVYDVSGWNGSGNGAILISVSVSPGPSVRTGIDQPLCNHQQPGSSAH